MTLNRVSRIFILICVAVMLKCTEPQVFNPKACSRMKFSHNSLHLHKLSGTWYEVGRYHSNVKKNLICSSLEVIVKDDGFVFIHSSIDNKREKSLVLAIEEGHLLENYDNYWYSPPILKTTDLTSKTSVNYQVLDTDYVTYAILWSCENMNSGFGSKVFAWVLTRDSRILSLQRQKWLIKRLDSIGINSDLILETPRVGCEVINTRALRDILNQMSWADELERTRTRVDCPKGYTCYPDSSTTPTPSTELPISTDVTCPENYICKLKDTTTKTQFTCPTGYECYAKETTEIPTSKTEMICPKHYICYPEYTNAEKPPYESPMLTEIGGKPSKASKISAKGIHKPTTEFGCPVGYKCAREPIITNEANLKTEIDESKSSESKNLQSEIDKPSSESQNLQTEIDKPSDDSPDLPTEIDKPSNESQNLQTEIDKPSDDSPDLPTEIDKPTTEFKCPKGYKCFADTTTNSETECSDPNCVPRASCYATTYASSLNSSTCPECNCTICPTTSYSEENRTKCEPQPTIATTTDGFTVGNCDRNGTTTSTYDYRANPKTTQPMAGEDAIIEKTTPAGNSSEVNTTQSDGDVDLTQPKIHRSLTTLDDPSNNNTIITSNSSESALTFDSFNNDTNNDTNTAKTKSLRKRRSTTNALG